MARKKTVSRMEEEIKEILTDYNIDFVRQYSVPNDKRLKLDFYLPDYNIAIECQGEQHFNAVQHFGGNKAFEKILDRDNRKALACAHADINIIYYINKFNKLYNNIYFNNILKENHKILYNRENCIFSEDELVRKLDLIDYSWCY